MTPYATRRWLGVGLLLAVTSAISLPATGSAATPAHVFCIPAHTETGTLCGLVRGNEVVRSPDLLEIGLFDQLSDRSVAPAQDANGAWGFIDHDGQWLTPPRFDLARSFSDDGLARVRMGDLWGFADRTGRVVVPTTYASARPFDHGLAAVRREKGWSYIDTSGSIVIDGPFQVALSFSSNGLAAVMPARKDQYGYIDRTGKLVIPARFDVAGSFDGLGLAPAALEKPVGDPEWELTDTIYGLIDTSGRWVLEPRYSSLQDSGHAGLYSFLHLPPGSSSEEGYIDRTGGVIFEGDQLARTMQCERTRSGSSGRFFGPDGKTEIDHRLDWTSQFNDSCFAMTIDGGDVALLGVRGELIQLEAGREPLLDPDGALVEFWRPGDASLIHVLGHEAEVLYFGLEGNRPVLRYRSRSATTDGQTSFTLSDAVGVAIWTSGSLSGELQARLAPTSATLMRDEREDAENPERWQQPIGDVLSELVSQPVRRFSGCSLFVFESCSDPYDLSELDSEWEPEDTADMVHFGSVELLATRYVDAGMWGSYDFLDSHASGQFRGYFDTWKKRLTTVLGKPFDDGEEVRHLGMGEGGDQVAWKRGERYVVLSRDVWIGDGDFEYQLLLAVVDKRSLSR